MVNLLTSCSESTLPGVSHEVHRKPLAVLITGDPVPSVVKGRGGFAELIRGTVKGAWDGPWVDIDLRSVDELPDPMIFTAFVITGSASSVTERAEWMLRGEEYLRTVVRQSVPVLGICFGHQLLGSALGGEVQRNPRGREIGTVEVRTLADDELLTRARPVARVNMTHVDSVVRLPPSAVVIAETEVDPNAAVRFSDTTWGVQFHPEMDGDVMRQYIAARRETMTQEGFDAQGIFDRVRDTPLGADVLRRFVEIIDGRRSELRSTP